MSRKQTKVVHSSTEAEYRVVTTTTQEIEAIRSLLEELGITVPVLMMILSNNLGATFIAQNPIRHIKLKHVALDLHFMRE